MIKTSNKIVDKTIQYLNTNYSVADTVYIKILEDYDSIEVEENGKRVFGLFDTDTKTIYIPILISEKIIKEFGINREEEIIRRIAHEYRHFMQMCNGAKSVDDFDEKDAEEFGKKIVKEILGKEGV